MVSVLPVVAVTAALMRVLELPGKLRLTREAYLAVQRICYPGFTIASGFGEGLAPTATAVLLFLTSPGGVCFWLTLAAHLSATAP